MRRAWILGLTLLATTASAEGWLCIADASTGFDYNAQSKTWDRKFFKADSKYVVRKANQDEEFLSVKMVVVAVGEKAWTATCPEDFDRRGNLLCDGLLTTFRFNSDNLKFMRVFSGGYFATEEYLAETERPDTPFMEIGRCTAL